MGRSPLGERVEGTPRFLEVRDHRAVARVRPEPFKIPILLRGGEAAVAPRASEKSAAEETLEAQGEDEPEVAQAAPVAPAAAVAAPAPAPGKAKKQAAAPEAQVAIPDLPAVTELLAG